MFDNKLAKQNRRSGQLKRPRSTRNSYDRILIVSEGSKTEPQYFKEIRSAYRLNTANIQIYHSNKTDPLSVVNYAENLFKEGNPHKQIKSGAFEQVYAIFDRDEHTTYFEAINKAQLLNNAMKNDLGQNIVFCAIPSIPSFELWLLLHFKDILAPLHRTHAFEQVKLYIPNYTKGADKIFEFTKQYLDTACKRAEELSKSLTVHVNEKPYTAIHKLVKILQELKK